MFQGFDTAIPDVIVIELQVFRDPRGFFLETYHQGRFAEFGIAEAFVQDNHSSSRRGTSRGLHYQLRHLQAPHGHRAESLSWGAPLWEVCRRSPAISLADNERSTPHLRSQR